MKVVFLREADDVGRRLKTTTRIVKELVAVSEGKMVSALTPSVPTPPVTAKQALKPGTKQARPASYPSRFRR